MAYVLPPATTTTLGGVIVDGATITAAPDGTISSTVVASAGNKALAVLTAEGVRRTTAGAATSLIPAAAEFTAPPNFFTVGKSLRFTMFGHTLNGGAWSVYPRLGGFAVVNPIPSVPGGAGIEFFFHMEVVLTCRSIGTNATYAAVGVCNRQVPAGQVEPILFPPSGETNALRPVFNSTIANVIDVAGALTAVGALQLSVYVLEELN